MAKGRILVQSHVGDGAALVCAARGDRKGLRQVYDRYAPVVLGVAQRILGDHARSEKVCAEVFIDIWESTQQSSGNRPLTDVLPLLLLQLSRAHALAALHRGQPQRMVSMDDTQMSMKLASSSSRMGPARAKVRTTMADLTGRQRSMLQLAYFEGLDTTQISQRASLTVDEVLDQIVDALRPLVTTGDDEESVVVTRLAHKAARYLLQDLEPAARTALEANLTADSPEIEAIRVLDTTHAVALYTLPIGPSMAVWELIDKRTKPAAAN